MKDIFLLTGGNIGDRLHNLQQAEYFIQRRVGTVIKKSSVYKTAPWGLAEQESFLNQVFCVDSALNAEELLQQLLSIELELGRKRLLKMGPRIIDIDILFYSNKIISTTDLIVPHPRIAGRRFVLTPLNEIAPNFIHPVLKKTIADLLKECPDNLAVDVYNFASQ